MKKSPTNHEGWFRVAVISCPFILYCPVAFFLEGTTGLFWGVGAALGMNLMMLPATLRGRLEGLR